MNRPAALRVFAFFVVLASILSAAPAALGQSSLWINELYRGGTFGTGAAGTDEWVEIVLRVPMTAAQLEAYYFGDSTAATAAKFSGYKFTNMGIIAANFPAGTIIVIAGTAGPAADLTFNPGANDWNITLKTNSSNLTSNSNTADFAGTDVAYVDTNGTNGDTTLSSTGFAVNWDSTPGTFGAVANVTIAVPNNNSGAVLNTGFDAATNPANWSVSVLAPSLTPGQPNGGANTTYIQNLRNPAPPTPALNISNVSAAEGAGGTTTFTFEVALTAPAGSGGVTFDIATADDTATDADNDYEPNSLTGQSIPMGSTGPYNFNVTVNGDANPEPTETFLVNVTNITGATPGDVQGVGTITTDDAPPTLNINDVAQAEGNAPNVATFAVTLTAPAPPGGVTFDIATQQIVPPPGPPPPPPIATAGTDYVHRALTAQTIPEGQTQYTFDVTINGDALFEGNEPYLVNVSNITGAVAGDTLGQGTINNDDAQPTFTIADVAVLESTPTITFTVTMTGASEQTATVNWATVDGTATVGDADYVGDSGMVSFVSGDTSEQFSITVNNDTNPEGDEHFTITLSGPTVATISDGTAFGVIKNDDPISIPAVNVPVTETFNGLHPAPSPSTPIGWTFVETGANANLFYNVDDGGSTTGDTYAYSFMLADPDKAFGTLLSGSLVSTLGAFYRNDTPATITSLTIQYTGEQWRLGDTGRVDRLDFQYSLDATSLSTGTWVHVDALDFNTPNTTGGGAKDGNALANRSVRTFTIPSLSIAPGQTFWIRYTDFNASGSDDGLAVDDFTLIANYTGALISIDDVSGLEGTGGSTTFTFTVNLSQPAPPGGVTYNIATAPGSATDPDDFLPLNLTGETIAEGASSKTYNITIVTDANPEPTESFFVNLSNVTNALVQDPQGIGTIVTDDVTVTLISQIQGAGAVSGMVGSSVTIRGIVTGVKSNGFFVQEEAADSDSGPGSELTSEGIFVFTSGTPPPAAVMGALVQVAGTVAEFVPGDDPLQPPLTELTSVTSVAQISTGNPLPAAIPLTGTFPNPAGPFDQLERVEGMRVTVSSLTVSAPSDGTFSETAGTGTSNGRFYGVVTGLPRPFREPGIQPPDPAPSGSIPPIPRWDGNPERLKVESAAIVGQPVLTVKTNDVLGPVTGPLDYGFRAYAILPDGTSSITVTPGTLPVTVTPPAGNDVTVASFNLQRFFDNVNDPGGDPLVTTTGYNLRLDKASIAIREHLHMPDIIGVQEAEKLAVLQDLAARISADAQANAQPDPLYVAYLEEGNDPGGIDVGFLVKTAPVAPLLPRVSNIVVTQEGKTTTWTNPKTGNPDELNDRPPLVLEAVVNRAPGLSYPITVINNHLRSLIGIEDPTIAPPPNHLTSEGDYVRRKRLAQALFLANLVQARQTADPAENIILVGDFNAFEFNDGYVDVMNVIAGTPPPDDQTVVPGDGPAADVVDPNLDNLVDTPPPTERYSYVHEGNAQNLDHALVNLALINSTTARRVEHPRIDADWPETQRNSGATALRISDHDPVLAYLTVPLLVLSDFGITIGHQGNGYVLGGTTTSYLVTVNNNGPDPGNATWSMTLAGGTTFNSLVPPPGWNCTTGAAISCTTTAPLGAGNQNFILTVNVSNALPPNAAVMQTVSVDAGAADANSLNDSDSETITVLQSSQYRATKTVSGSFLRGSNVTYTVTIFNDKPFTQGDNFSTEFSDTLPASLSLVSANATSGTAAVGLAGPNHVSWNGSIPSGGSVTITIVATILPSASGTISNQGTGGHDWNNDGFNESIVVTDDPSAGGTADPTNFTVATAGVAAIKNVSGTFVSGSNVVYTVVLANNMALTQNDNPGHEFTDVLPAGLAFVRVTPSSGTAGLEGGNTVVWDGSIPANGGAVSITIEATITAASGTISNQGQAFFDADGDNVNESSTVTDNQATPTPNDPAVFNVVPANSFIVTKRDTGGPRVPGGTVIYEIVLTNGFAFNIPDNPGFEFTDTLPPQLGLVVFSATSGAASSVGNQVRWSGSIPSGQSVTLSITAHILQSNTPGTISNQGTVTVDLDNNGTNETTRLTDDPDTPAADDPTSFVLNAPSQVTATKSVSTSGLAGSAVTYTVVLTNNLAHTLADNAGNELTDILPAQLQLVSASATSGTAVSNVGTRTVTWNGSIPGGGSVTITINATIPANAAPGAVSNQGTASVDVDNSGDNESQIVTDNPATPAVGDATTFTVTSASQFTATKTVSTSGVQGTSATYTVTLTNNLPHALPDNAGNELTDVIPAPLQLVSANATGGTVLANTGTNTVTWNGSLASGASVTLTIETAIPPNATPGTVSNQGTASVDADNNGSNESTILTDDPATPAANDPTAFTISSAAAVSAAKTVATTAEPGSTVTYTIVITNNLPHALQNNPGDELVDVLPSQLILTGASATSGTATFETGTRTVRWNGSIPTGGSVTITITAQLDPNAQGAISNQATVNVDLDNNGTNETAILTDDPGPGGPTVFQPTSHENIPALSWEMLAALGALLAAAAVWKTRA